MTPEEKFNQNIWWTLQIVKAELIATPKGDYVKVNWRSLTNLGYRSPFSAIRDMARGIRKLEELGAFSVVEKHDTDTLDPYHSIFVDWDDADEFLLSINRNKFDALYNKYEKSQHNRVLTTADKKKLYILEKLKELRDFGGMAQVSVAEGRYEKWLAECDIEQYQLEDILMGFMRKGLIESFEFKVTNPAV